MSAFKLSQEGIAAMLKWSISGDTGTSSMTIAQIACGFDKSAGSFGWDIPHDGADFGRCYRLLKAVPELVNALPLVAEKCPKWKPLFQHWDELTRLYEQDLSEEPRFEKVSRGRGRKAYNVQVNQRACYDLLRELYDDCMAAAGYIKSGTHSWSKDGSSVLRVGNVTIGGAA